MLTPNTQYKFDWFFQFKSPFVTSATVFQHFQVICNIAKAIFIEEGNTNSHYGRHCKKDFVGSGNVCQQPVNDIHSSTEEEDFFNKTLFFNKSVLPQSNLLMFQF